MASVPRQAAGTTIGAEATVVAGQNGGSLGSQRPLPLGADRAAHLGGDVTQAEAQVEEVGVSPSPGPQADCPQLGPAGELRRIGGRSEPLEALGLQGGVGVGPAPGKLRPELRALPGESLTTGPALLEPAGPHRDRGQGKQGKELGLPGEGVEGDAPGHLTACHFPVVPGEALAKASREDPVVAAAEVPT